MKIVLKATAWGWMLVAVVAGPAALRAADGTLILHGGGLVSSEVRDKFLQLAGGENARLLIISTADPDTPLDPERVISWRESGPASVALLHAETREEAELESFAAPLKQATGVWISGGRQTTLASRYLGTPVERELTALLARGGVIAGTSAGAAILSRVMIVRGEVRQGFDLCPQAVVDQHYVARAREERLLRVLSAHPRCFGIGVDEDTAAIIRGNALSILGSSTVSICVTAGDQRPQRLERLKAGDTFDLKPLRTLLSESATGGGGN